MASMVPIGPERTLIGANIVIHPRPIVWQDVVILSVIVSIIVGLVTGVYFYWA